MLLWTLTAFLNATEKNRQPRQCVPVWSSNFIQQNINNHSTSFYFDSHPKTMKKFHVPYGIFCTISSQFPNQIFRRETFSIEKILKNAFFFYFHHFLCDKKNTTRKYIWWKKKPTISNSFAIERLESVFFSSFHLDTLLSIFLYSILNFWFENI